MGCHQAQCDDMVQGAPTGVFGTPQWVSERGGSDGYTQEEEEAYYDSEMGRDHLKHNVMH